MQPLLFLDALEESPSGSLDLPADGSCIRREGVLETCLVRRPLSGGAERYSDPTVTC